MLDLVAVSSLKIRAVGDRELSKSYPGWFCVMFHQVKFNEDTYVYELTYSVQMSEGAEPVLAKIELWQSVMLDGSPTWVPLGVL